MERDVVGLPLERRLAGVDRRDDLLVDRAAIVVLGLEAVGVEDLELVVPAEVDAAVAAALPARLGHVGHVEFEMELEVAEPLLVMISPPPTVKMPSATGQSAGVLPSRLTQP